MTISPVASNYCAVPLAGYAIRPDMTRGRLVSEPDSQYRTPFQRDRDRIIHSNAFRRLKYKTQVFVHHEGDDHYRTRLTHTLEVVQIARTLARALLVNEDLSEAIALGHDLGHAPFGHVGGDALNDVMKPYGGFEHNDQSLRVVTHLEERYPEWRGLNLSWEVLEGLAKHNGPKKGRLAFHLNQYNDLLDLRLQDYASAEAQIVDFADDIAYCNHDVEDGLRSKLFTLQQLENEVDLYADILPRIRADYPHLTEGMQIKEAVRDIIGLMVDDLIQSTRANLARLNIETAEDVRKCGQPSVIMSSDVFAKMRQLRQFLTQHMYFHQAVRDMCDEGGAIIKKLFTTFMRNPSLLPDQGQTLAKGADEAVFARYVADYIAGMTDRFATKEYQNLFDAGS
ncbi:MAG: deoxyguanosinetriphosphate triphosphohydrolase [Pseudomonadota bacterium]